MKNIKVLGIAGSIRKASYNGGLLRAAKDIAPEGIAIDVFNISPIPVFNEDVRLAGEPESVTKLKTAIAAADALLFAAPEYNYSIPGVLKNAIDWASRPPESSPFKNKPAAIMGAGYGSGSMRSQIHLRQVLQCIAVLTLNKPEMYVHISPTVFDAAGNLIDPAIKEKIKKLLSALVDWTIKMGAPENQ